MRVNGKDPYMRLHYPHSTFNEWGHRDLSQRLDLGFHIVAVFQEAVLKKDCYEFHLVRDENETIDIEVEKG